MKKLITLLASVALSVMLFMCGCASFSLNGGATNGKDGRDGKDGKDVDIYEIYEAAKTVPGNESLTFDGFLKKYLSYSGSELSDAASLKSVINRSLMTSVSILTRFNYGHSSSKVFVGSGVVLYCDKSAGDMYVVTNCHVIYDDTSKEIFSTDVRLYLYGQDVAGVNYIYDSYGNISDDENFAIPATVIGASVSYDIALLKVTGSDVVKRNDIYTASFSSAEDACVGEFVYAIGNAEGEGVSASDGIISRDSEFIDLSLSDKNSNDMRQYRVMRVTAPINHGNSGGGLFNTSGELVGIVNAKSDESDVDNMGYVLPASNVKRLLKLMYDEYASNGGMRSGGGVDRALLKVTTTVSDSYARLNPDTGLAEITEVVKVSSIDGAPASGKFSVGETFKAIKITDSDGTVKEDMQITRRYHVQDLMLSVRRGDTVTLTMQNSEGTHDVSITYTSSYFYYYD